MRRSRTTLACVIGTAAATALAGCSGRPAPRSGRPAEAPASKQGTSSADYRRYIGRMYGTSNLRERRELLAEMSETYETTSAAKAAFSDARFPRDLLGGKLAWIGVTPNVDGGALLMLTDNGMEIRVERRAEPFDPEQEVPRPGRGQMLPPPGPARGNDASPEVVPVWDGRGIGSDSGLNYRFANPFPRPGSLSWGLGNIRFTIVGFNRTVEELRRVAESMR